MDKQPDHSSARQRRASKQQKQPSRSQSENGAATQPANAAHAETPGEDSASKLPGVFGAVSRKRLSSLVQTSIFGAFQGLQDLAAEADAALQGACKKQVQALQRALRFVHKTFPSEDAPEKVPDVARDWAIDPDQAKAFGRMIEKARDAAELSAIQLGKLAGLSEQTIYNVEHAANVPTHATVVRLLAVKELGINSDQVPWRRPLASELGSSPNCWIAPGYDPLKMFAELFEALNNGRGGIIEQTYSYLDHQSAMHWFELSNQSSYATMFRQSMKLEPMAQKILAETGRAGLDVIALGSGDGKQEVRLVQHLLAHGEHRNGTSPNMRLFLIDISQPLLSSAYQHAAETLGKRSVYICAVQGNFHDWPQYTQFHHGSESSHRRRIACMLGLTIGNLDNEARYFQHTLIGFAPGDMLLLDVQLACGAPEHPDEIRRKDKLLHNGFQPSHKEWLGGPLRRYITDAIDVELQPALDVHSNVVPGSYTIDTQATVKLKGGREKHFSIFRFKRYDPQRLADMLRHLGWELLSESPFGPDPNAPVQSLLLFRRLSPSMIE